MSVILDCAAWPRNSAMWLSTGPFCFNPFIATMAAFLTEIGEKASLKSLRNCSNVLNPYVIWVTGLLENVFSMNASFQGPIDPSFMKDRI